VVTLERQCLDMKTDKLQLMMEMTQMQQDYEQRRLSCHQSAAVNGDSV